MTEEKRFSGVTVAGAKEAPAISTADHWGWCEDHNTPKAICGCGSDDGQATTTGYVVIGDQRILPPPAVEPANYAVDGAAAVLSAMSSAEIDGVAELLVRFNRDNALRLAQRLSALSAAPAEFVIGPSSSYTLKPIEVLLEPNGTMSSAPQAQAPVADQLVYDAPATLTGGQSLIADGITGLFFDDKGCYTFKPSRILFGASEIVNTVPPTDIPLEPAPDMPYETVRNPSHYDHPTIAGLKAIDVIQDFPYNVATAMAYLWRCGRKPGADPLEDLRKARQHIDFELRRLETAQKGGATWPNV